MTLTLLAYFLPRGSAVGLRVVRRRSSPRSSATGATALLWRQPTREQSAIGGLVVVGVSVLRVGLPTQWGGASLVVILVTALLAVPLVQAVMVLPRT